MTTPTTSTGKTLWRTFSTRTSGTTDSAQPGGGVGPAEVGAVRQGRPAARIIQIWVNDADIPEQAGDPFGSEAAHLGE